MGEKTKRGQKEVELVPAPVYFMQLTTLLGDSEP